MAGSNNLLVDTNIILYAAVYNDDIATELLTENNIFISDITEIELLGYHRLSDEEYVILSDFIATLTVIPINSIIKQKAIDLRRKFALKTPDSIIAATALQLGYFLVTADKKLQKIDDLQVVEFQAP